MAGRDRDGDLLFRDTRRDWISDRATRRDDFERDRSPMRRSEDQQDAIWNKDRFVRDGRDDRRRSRSPDRRSRDINRPLRISSERESRRNSSMDRDRFGRDHGGTFQRSRDSSATRTRPFDDHDRGLGGRRTRERSLDRVGNDLRWDGRDPFDRERSRNRDKRSPDRPLRSERDRSPRGQDSTVEKKVDNWGRELRLGGERSRNTRQSPDRVRMECRKSPDRRRPRDISRNRDQMRRSRERDWKRSVDDFLGARGSRGGSPSSKGRLRDKAGAISGRDMAKWADKTEEEWDREIKQFERERCRYVPVSKRDDDKLQSPKRQHFQDRKSSDRTSSKDRSRDYPQGSRSRAPAVPSPKRKSRDRTPVVDEKSDGEDMVISDEDNNEDSKISTDDWENTMLMKYSSINDQPQKTIVVRRMPAHISELDIHLDITSCNLVCHDIRLVRRKDTGSSRGFAFVEFYTVEDAMTWMEKKQRILKLGKAECFMEYSVPKEGTAQLPVVHKFVNDWICNKCQAHNFSKRYLCYICNASRMYGQFEGADILASEHPTNTVVLIGLDILTSEETVLKTIASLSNLPMRSVKIARDPLTNLSLGACYLEMNNVLDAYNLHQSLKESIPEIDGKRPEVKYAKLDANQITSQAISILPKSATGSGKMGNTAIAAAQWSHQSSSATLKSTVAENYTLADVPRLAEYSATMYAKTRQEKIAYYSYYQNYYKKMITEGNPVYLPDDSASGLANAQAALATSLAGASSQSADSLAEPPDGSGTATYPMPDTSQYQYDPSSGFYYDPFTKLYFDANSQYYYNSKLGKYLYWDPARHTYLPTPSTAQLPEMSQANQDDRGVIVGAPQPANKQDDKKKEKEGDADRVKVAKRIAKDMEKWAKTLNQKKETAKQSVAPASAMNAPSRFGPTSGAADIGFAVLERKDHLSTLGNYFNPVPLRHEIPAAPIISQAAMESDEEDESGEDKSHTDWEKLICLLCKRQLGSREALMKHQQISDLHKQNLAAWYRSRGLDPDDAQMRQNQYRDRASERRQKYGLPDTPKPSRLKESYIKAREAAYDQPTMKGIGSDNLGNKLLQKMGWQEGMGLGKKNQGRTSIIEAKRRTATAGLGSRAVGVTPGPGETYKECVKKMMAARYAQLED